MYDIMWHKNDYAVRLELTIVSNIDRINTKN